MGTSSTSPMSCTHGAGCPTGAPVGTHVSGQLGRQRGHLLLRGLQLTAQLADLLWGESGGMRGARHLPSLGAGPGMSRGYGLTSDCIFSSAWQHESRERQTDRGRQSGGQRGTDRLSARQRHAQSPPQSHPDPPAMHKAAQHGGGSYGGVGGGRAGGQGQHRSVNCNTGKPGVSGCPGEQHPGATAQGTAGDRALSGGGL